MQYVADSCSLCFAGSPSLCIHECTEALAMVLPAACSGLAAALYRQRAGAHLSRGAPVPAEQDVLQALQLEPYAAESHKLHAEVWCLGRALQT